MSEEQVRSNEVAEVVAVLQRCPQNWKINAALVRSADHVDKTAMFFTITRLVLCPNSHTVHFEVRLDLPEQC